MAIGQTLKVISDPVRREILEFLKNEPQTAGAISDQFNLSKATVSYHLKLLKEAGLIDEHKDKNFIFYELNASVFQEVLNWIYNLALGGKNDDQNKN